MSVRLITAALLSSAFLFSQSTLFAGTQRIRSNFSKQVDNLFDPWNKTDVPGAAIAIIQEGEVIYKKCFGLANLEHKVPIRNETVFNLASASKQFTAVAVLLLEQQGRLSLDDDIHDYFPELPDYGTIVTLRHLIHHTSGLWEYSKMFRYYGGYKPADHTSIEDVLAMLENQDQLLFEPGSQWLYCNTNYALLGNLVERVTNESLGSWTKKHIFEPLEMHNTSFQDDCYYVIPHKASCYYRVDGLYKHNPRNSTITGPGYLWTTVDDMILWLENFRHRRVGGDSLVERLFKKSVLNDGSESFYGYGLGVGDRNGKTIISHSGQTGSFKTMMIYVQEDNLGIIVLANNGHINAENLAYEILDLFYVKAEKEKEKTEEIQTREPEPFISIDSIDTEGYGGAYLIEGGQGRLLVSRQSNSLYCIFDGFGSDFFYPLSDSVFMNIYRNVTFWLNFDNKHVPTGLVLDLKGDTMKADRIDIPVLTPEQLTSTYAGVYYCDALDIAYHVIVKNGKLVIQHRRYADRPLQATDDDEFSGGIGIVRFSRDEGGAVDGFRVSDEDTNFKPLAFRKISRR